MAQNDFEDYLEKYCNTYFLTREEALQQKVVQLVLQQYQGNTKDKIEIDFNKIL